MSFSLFRENECVALVGTAGSYIRMDPIGNIYNQANFLNENVVRILFLEL
jgi:hypothetical protein